jgi:hypothetical protein
MEIPYRLGILSMAMCAGMRPWGWGKLCLQPYNYSHNVYIW